MVWRNCIVMLGCKGLTGLSFISLLLTMSKLELPLGDIKMMAMEIEEYHTYLAQMSTFAVSELFLVTIISLWLLFQRNAQIPQEYQAVAD